MTRLYACGVCVCVYVRACVCVSVSVLYGRDSIEIVILKIYYSDSRDDNNNIVRFQ